jgi:hypothetical protein
MAEKKETQTAAKSDTVTVKFVDGTDEKGKTIYREQEVGRELAEAELAKPETAPKELKEGEVLKLRNPAWKGAEIVK